MKYNFKNGANRIGTNSVKWNFADNNLSVLDYSPLWIADMDFDVAPEITNAIIERAKHPIYGYIEQDKEIFDLIVSWQKRRHNISIEKEDIILSTGVCHTYYQIIELLLKKDEKVIFLTPIYPPFYKTPENLDREYVECPLINNNDRYSIDYDLFEKMIEDDPKIKLFNLCNPHNPLGICFTKKELTRLIDICLRHNVYVHSDEIHGDLIMPGTKFTSALEVDDKYQDIILTSWSPTKTFNLAGLKVCYVIVKNKELREKLKHYLHSSGVDSVNIFGMEALRAAYKYCDNWVDECLEVIYENFKFTKEYVEKELPGVKFEIPEGTYLGFMNLTAFDLPVDYIERLVNEAHVQFNAGKVFKADYRYLRINVACPKDQLELGLNHLRDWLKSHKYI